MALRNPTSDELRDQARRKCQQTLDRQRKKKLLTEAAADMLQEELNIGGTPDLYWDADDHVWYVWSAFDQRRYTLAEWEALVERYVLRDQKGSRR